MNTNKYQKMMDLIVNGQEDKARVIFHDLVLENSRRIFESIMEEEGDDEYDFGGETGDFIDDTVDTEFGEEEFGHEDGLDDIDMVDVESEGEGFEDDSMEDTMVRIEDKLDELIAEFSELMDEDDGGVDDDAGEDDTGSEEEFGSEDDVDSEDDEFGGDFGSEDEDEDDDVESLAEAIEMIKVSVEKAPDGENRKSPVPANSGAKGMEADPVNFSSSNETVPTGPKEPSNEYTKGRGEIKGASEYKNTPARKSYDTEKAAKPSGDSEGLTESRRRALRKTPARKPVRAPARKAR